MFGKNRFNCKTIKKENEVLRMEEDIKYIDAENYQGGSSDKISFRLIALNYLRKIGILSAVEFRGGFYLTHITKSGEEKELYVPDTRDTYCNAVEYFYTILYPHFDDKMKKKGIAFEKLIEDNAKDFMEKSSVDETIILGSSFYTETKDKIFLEEYKNKKLSLFIKLFRYINSFLKRTYYMEGASFEDDTEDGDSKKE